MFSHRFCAFTLKLQELQLLVFDVHLTLVYPLFDGINCRLPGSHLLFPSIHLYNTLIGLVLSDLGQSLHLKKELIVNLCHLLQLGFILFPAPSKLELLLVKASAFLLFSVDFNLILFQSVRLDHQLGFAALQRILEIVNLSLHFFNGSVLVKNFPQNWSI